VVRYRDRDGNLHTETIDNRKGSVTHYANLQVWKGTADGQAEAPRRPASAPRKPAADLPPDDYDPDSTPF
jgi:hypothetical protein